MTRIESSARDYAIAALSSGDLSPLDALQAVMRLDGFGCWLEVNNAAARGMASADPMTALRILRARVALYLRTIRRSEAWGRAVQTGDETCDDWACPKLGWSKGVVRWHPWRPLWLGAPPFDPDITPRQRRAAA